MVRIAMAVVLAAMTVVAAAGPAGAEEGKAPPSWVKLEAKGKLSTGIMAIGGETTGTILTTSAGTFELELNKMQSEEAEKLNRKSVIVTGTLNVKKRVTGSGTRSIIKVATLKEAK